MAGVMPLEVPVDGWTVDDLPEDVRRCELVDGVLLVTPAPAFRHQRATLGLLRVLLPHLPSHLDVVLEPGLHFDARNYRQPDMVVYDRRAIARDRLEPRDVHLAVEVMSPSSVSTDRITKPAQYAAAGIPHLWRLELDPLLLVVHRLGDDAYEVVGRYEDEVRLEEPVPVAFWMSSLLG
jgi:Uma2 family endonuclease